MNLINRPQISLLKLKVPMATGACYLGADVADGLLDRNYGDNTQVFFSAKI
jgi:hypothetical protein